MLDLQEKIGNPSLNTSEVRDYSPQSRVINSDQGSPRSNLASRIRDVVKKGMVRLEKQIVQLISVHISWNQVDIALLKKCKTIDVPAMNSAIGNVQRALQKYVEFNRMDSEYCDNVAAKTKTTFTASCLQSQLGTLRGISLYNTNRVKPFPLP